MLIKDTSFIDLPVFVKGVQDVYEVGRDILLMIMTRRISASMLFLMI